MAMPFRRLPALASLRAFEAAARLSSFKEAAAELAVTPGAVSQQIRALEDDLGVKLFNRAVRAVTLTEAGQSLQPAVSSAFLQLRDAVDQVRPKSTRPLRVESSGPIIRKWLLPRLHRFAERYPELPVSFETVSHISGFDKDGPDVVIRFTRSPGEGLFAVKLCEDYLMPLASPALIAQLDLKHPTDIVRAPLVHDSSAEVFGQNLNWTGWFSQAGINTAGAQRGMRFERQAADHAIDAAVNGAGVVLARRFLARNEMLDGRLVMPFGPVIPMHVSYFVVCQKGDETRPEIASFINWSREEAAILEDGAGIHSAIA